MLNLQQKLERPGLEVNESHFYSEIYLDKDYLYGY